MKNNWIYPALALVAAMLVLGSCGLLTPEDWVRVPVPKAIQKEMGDLDETPSEAEEIKRKIEDAGMPVEARDKANAELNKLKMMSPMSSEASVVRTYLDWMVTVPWKKRTKIQTDLPNAEATLEADHYGLTDVKDRILEYLAVQKRVKKLKGPILCLVGPPGVGKTSLGESIARATGRKFVRMALGGVRDEIIPVMRDMRAQADIVQWRTKFARRNGMDHCAGP